jgi:catechol-2,3-dioxygenase
MSRIRPTKFAHVVYRTRRYDSMLHWYQTVFDARVQHQDPGLAFLTYDEEHHRFAIANLDVIQPGGIENDHRGLIGVDHVAYAYGTLIDLFENYAHLKDQGIKPYWCVHHGFTVSMYYADPDGNQMEFQVDSFGSKEEAAAFMAGPNFAANPIGVEYDPDEWLARLRAGVPASAFLHRQTDEPRSPIRGSIEIGAPLPRD